MKRINMMSTGYVLSSREHRHFSLYVSSKNRLHFNAINQYKTISLMALALMRISGWSIEGGGGQKKIRLLHGFGEEECKGKRENYFLFVRFQSATFS
jgi:hypothetical protein